MKNIVYDPKDIGICEREKDRVRDVLLSPADGPILQGRPVTMEAALDPNNRVTPEYVAEVVATTKDHALELKAEMERMFRMGAYPGQNLVASWTYTGWWDNERLLKQIEAYEQWIALARNQPPQDARATLADNVVAPMLMGAGHKDPFDQNSEWISFPSKFCEPARIAHGLEYAKTLDTGRFWKLVESFKESGEELYDKTVGRVTTGLGRLAPLLAIGIGAYVGIELIKSMRGRGQ